MNGKMVAGVVSPDSALAREVTELINDRIAAIPALDQHLSVWRSDRPAVTYGPWHFMVAR